MPAQIRLVLLVLVLAYSVAFGSGQSLGAAKKRGYTTHRLKGQWPRMNRRAATAAAVVNATGAPPPPVALNRQQPEAEQP